MQLPFDNRMLTSMLAMMRIAPPYIADFDSASGMLRATAAYLRGEDFPGVGIAPPMTEPLISLVNQLPRSLQESIYIRGSAGEAIAADQLGNISADAVAQWMVSEYPQRSYPAVAIGSSCGAMVHLYAALDMPWLPQTFLIPVKHPGIDPDEPKKILEWSKQPARDLLEANPDLTLYQMHDPSQDRLTSQGMSYFRVKRLRLGKTYERFLENSLPRGGTIFLVECQRTFPTTQVSDRHIFQFGALGGATAEEFLHGGERVAQFLEKYQSPLRQWDSPTPDRDRPEAEWGFEPSLREDVERFARQRGYRVRRITFVQPEDMSPFVAEFYRWWYKQRQIVSNRLLVESFILQEPFWTLRTGSVPFWMKFNTEVSFNWLNQYLDSTDAYDQIYMMLFSHGTDSIGLSSIEDWRTVLNRARLRGEFVGVDEDKYPRDFATFMHYYTDLPKTIRVRYPLPEPLALEKLDQFISERGDAFPVNWSDNVLSDIQEGEETAHSS